MSNSYLLQFRIVLYTIITKVIKFKMSPISTITAVFWSKHTKFSMGIPSSNWWVLVSTLGWCGQDIHSNVLGNTFVFPIASMCGWLMFCSHSQGRTGTWGHRDRAAGGELVSGYSGHGTHNYLTHNCTIKCNSTCVHRHTL